MDAARTEEAIRVHVARLCEFTAAPPALAPFPGLRELRAHLDVLCADPACGPLEWAMLANAHTREGRYLDAIAAYERALALEPRFAAAHLAIAELASMLHDDALGSAHRARALALQRCFLDAQPVGERIPVALLLRDAPYSVNTPIELLVDRTRIALHKVYIEGDVELPPHAVAMCAFGYAHDAVAAIERAGEILAADAAASINAPARLASTARERLPETLAGIDGVEACETRAVAASELLGVPLPALVRPRDTHAGRGLALVATADDLRAHAERFPSPAYHVSRYVAYANGDGYFRKYRAILVDGVAYPYHLAIATRWMVHYQGSPMREHAWMREEEARYLAEPARVVPGWFERLGAIARAIGLDYAGIDFAIMPDGTLFVFEADAAMLVHDEDADGVFHYKRRYVAHIRDAVHALVARLAHR